MTIAIGQTSKGGAGTGLNGASTSAVTTSASGSTFVVGIVYDKQLQTVTSISDTISGSASGNSWTLIGSDTTTFSPNIGNRLYYCSNANGGATHVFTFATSGSASFDEIYVLEITSAATASFDKSAGPVADTSSPFSSGATATTSQANEMLVGFMVGSDSGANPATHASSGSTPSSGWVFPSGCEELDGSTKIVGGLCYNIVSATGTYTFSYTETGASTAGAAIATFMEAAAVVMALDALMFGSGL